MKLVTPSLVLTVVAASAILVFGKTPLKWETLRVTWGPVPISSFYDKMPLTAKEAQAKGWKTVSSSCSNEESGKRFSGFRYIKNKDTSISVIYNINGIISGIQMNPKVKELAVNRNDYKFDQVSMFQKNRILDDVTYSLTAYFSEPSTICNPATARTETELKNNGLGEKLFFQDGESSAANYEAPKNRQVALKTGWNNNNCFPGMGWHTWYKSEDLVSTNCTVGRPAFLLFNKDQDLIGFGFNVVGRAKSSSGRYEHPPRFAVKAIMGNPPPCLIDRQKKVGLTTMHVFMVPYLSIPKLGCVNPF